MSTLRFSLLTTVLAALALAACASPETAGRHGLVDCSDLTKHQVCRDLAEHIIHRY